MHAPNYLSSQVYCGHMGKSNANYYDTNKNNSSFKGIACYCNCFVFSKNEMVHY